MASVPIYTVYGDATPFAIGLDPIGSGNATLTIDGNFAGRDVEEELPIEALVLLAGEEPFSYDDLLGLNLKTDGKRITGLIGVGSGNEPFALHPEDLRAAIGSL
ncbi:MAG: hypothetical protein ACO1SV_23700 [Fimbriimonas sp.]